MKARKLCQTVSEVLAAYPVRRLRLKRRSEANCERMLGVGEAKRVSAGLAEHERTARRAALLKSTGL